MCSAMFPCLSASLDRIDDFSGGRHASGEWHNDQHGHLKVVRSKCFHEKGEVQLSLSIQLMIEYLIIQGVQF